jgi:hypothetical protein
MDNRAEVSHLAWTLLGIGIFSLLLSIIIVWYIELNAKGGRG